MFEEIMLSKKWDISKFHIARNVTDMTIRNTGNVGMFPPAVNVRVVSEVTNNLISSYRCPHYTTQSGQNMYIYLYMVYMVDSGQLPPWRSAFKDWQ